MAFFCRFENIASFLTKLIDSCCLKESECPPSIHAEIHSATTFWRRAAVVLRMLQLYDNDAVQICAELYSVVMKEVSDQANITSFATDLIFWTIEQVGVAAYPYIRSLKDVPEDWYKELGDRFWAELWCKDSGLASTFQDLSFEAAYMVWVEDKTVYVPDTVMFACAPPFLDTLLRDGLIEITNRMPDGLQLHRYRSLAWIMVDSSETGSSLIQLEKTSPPGEVDGSFGKEEEQQLRMMMDIW
jgi:hypothetical protein